MNAEMHAPASQTRLGIAILHHAVFLQLAAGHGAMLMDLMMVLVELVLPHAELETNQEAAMMGVGPAGMKHKAAILQNAVFLQLAVGHGAMLMHLMMAWEEHVLLHAELETNQESAMMGVGPAGMKHKAAILHHAVSQSMVDGATGADGAMLMDLMMVLVELVLPHAELDNRQGQ